jgi:5-methylcytosine-specific restriction endonuclease McrA
VSGGSSKPDPYHQKDPPKRSKVKEDEEQLPKVYRDAVRPKRIEVLPNGRKKFIYDCAHCGKEKAFDARKTAKHAFCDRKCFNEWQKYGKPPPKLTPEGAKKISDLHKGLWADKDHREKRTKAINKTRQTTEYQERHRKGIRKATSKPSWKKKQSEARKGKKRPPEVGKKISAAKMGHPVSDITREKLAKACGGENSSFYIDGRSSERQQFYRSWVWEKQKERVLQRDNFTCQGCGWTEEEAGPLECHHIDPLRETEYDWKKYPDDLVVPLCGVCHPNAERQEGRMKPPINGRGEDARLDRLENPPWKQMRLDE